MNKNLMSALQQHQVESIIYYKLSVTGLPIEQYQFEPLLGSLCCDCYSHNACLHPGHGVLMGTGKFNAGDKPTMDYRQHPIQRGVEKYIMSLCYRNWDMLQLYEPFGWTQTLT